MIVGDAGMAEPSVVVFRPFGVLPEQQSGGFEGQSAYHALLTKPSFVAAVVNVSLMRQMFCAVADSRTPRFVQIAAMKSF